ncbi:MAG: hypothetical protein AAF556_08485 [Pseudomonadota bacterium]
MGDEAPRPFRVERQRGGTRPPAESKPLATPPAGSPSLTHDRLDALMEAIGRVESRVTTIADHIDPADGQGRPALMTNDGGSSAEQADGAAEIQNKTFGHDLVRDFRSISAGNRRINGAADELTSVIQTTEQATEDILSACEAIDDTANDLSQQLINIEPAEHLVPEIAVIRDNVVRIFQASSFQDLTGQRLTNVTQILMSIEDRLQDLEQAMGLNHETSDQGEDEQACIDPNDKHFDESGLLNGPAMDGGISQDDIDKLFG